jgi:hypothetical protein
MLIAVRIAGLSIVSIGIGIAQGQSKKPSPFPANIPQAVLTLPAGTTIYARLNQSIGTATNRQGERFAATLDSPLQVGGKTVVSRGAEVLGTVREASSSGRFRGRAVLTLSIESINQTGRHIPVQALAVSNSRDRGNVLSGLFPGGRQEVLLPADTVLKFRLAGPALAE